MQCCHQIGVVHHTGHFVYVIAVHSKSACSPNFEGFPWGVQVVFISFRFRIDEHLQVCSLQFGSWINSQYGVEYRLPRNSTVGLTDFQQTVGWQVPFLKVTQQLLLFPHWLAGTFLESNPKTPPLISSAQVVNTKSRLVSGLARNPLVIIMF